MLLALAKLILAGRFLLIVFFLGLMWGLALFAVRFLGKLWELTIELWQRSEADLLIDVLHLLDSVLVASLVVMVALSSYDSLVDRLQGEADEQEMRWVSRTDHGNLKIKVATAMVAISSIHLLQIFLQAETQNETAIFWRVVIHMVFLVGAVLLGILDRLGMHHGDAGKNERV
ncbi:YqhA family protein [Sabulicella rubraurantiaca]|uniref:YqhA family protein n=1 Tax=Sabulicella rubraurantiaca TaxID=2811429 RepID=UPI001A97AB63|nr:YqhA family protein [Sabulicella rubraurantiaca]